MNLESINDLISMLRMLALFQILTMHSLNLYCFTQGSGEINHYLFRVFCGSSPWVWCPKDCTQTERSSVVKFAVFYNCYLLFLQSTLIPSFCLTTMVWIACDFFHSLPDTLVSTDKCSSDFNYYIVMFLFIINEDFSLILISFHCVYF